MDSSSFSVATEAFWFINSLVTVKAAPASTNGKFSLFHQVAPPGFTTPYHHHVDEDESLYVLDGEVAFFKDGVHALLTAGDFVFVPRGIAHGFRVHGSVPATMLLVGVLGDKFIEFVREMGEPAAEPVLPTPTPPDLAKLKALSEKYGSVIHGRLPG